MYLVVITSFQRTIILFYFLLFKSELPSKSLLEAEDGEEEPLLDKDASFNSREESEEILEEKFL